MTYDPMTMTGPLAFVPPYKNQMIIIDLHMYSTRIQRIMYNKSYIYIYILIYRYIEVRYSYSCICIFMYIKP